MLSLIARPFVPPGNSSSWFLRASSLIAICRSPGDVQLDYQQLARPTHGLGHGVGVSAGGNDGVTGGQRRSEEHTSELQSQSNLVCRLLLEKKKKKEIKTKRLE